MLTFRRIHHDYALVCALITAPGSWDAATDDSVGAASEWRPNEDPRIWYVLARDDAGIIGLFTLLPQNVVCWEIHATRLFGRGAGPAFRSCIQWAFANTSARRIVATVLATNRIALRATQRAGMKIIGVNPRSFLKNGMLVDLILLGISGPEL